MFFADRLRPRRPLPTLPAAGPLIWSEEFTTFNPAVWDCNLGNWTPGIQNYTSSNHRIASDGLTITTRREADGTYTSSRLVTRENKSFKPPVRIVANIHTPTSTPCWPAFWLMGDTPSGEWPDCGEIDVMEQMPPYPKDFATNLHGPKITGPGDVATGNTWAGPTLGGAFHHYGIDWYSDRMDFHLDGTIRWTITKSQREEAGGAWTPFDGHMPFYLILNMAVLDPASSDVFPQSMTVDSIKAWSLR